MAADQRRRLMCLQCGVQADTTEPLKACPVCGDTIHIPADLDDSVTPTISRHELRILTMWADNWARQCGPSAQRCLGNILTRLATQTDTDAKPGNR